MKLLFLSLCIAVCFNLPAQEMKVSSGKLIEYLNFESNFVPSRTVRIWLPDNYDSANIYSVIYMHDGQLLFDSSVTWNNQSWDVDDKISELIGKDKIETCIVVAIDNGNNLRHTEYFPQKIYNNLPEQYLNYLDTLTRSNGYKVLNGEVNSDAYLRFLVEELKPFVDSNYSTNPSRENTFVMGSSMGGLISLYAICEYPQIFGGAACLSTHWTVSYELENNPIPDLFVEYLNKNLPGPHTTKIYFDHGTLELDALYIQPQQKIDRLMREKGFTKDSWNSHVFEGASHSERDWNARLDTPLIFLLGK
jgi:predicted alpha/beta superfamily hydrolase